MLISLYPPRPLASVYDMVTERGKSSSGKSYAERMVAMSLPLPVGEFMRARATLVVAVKGFMGVTRGEDEAEEDGSGAMVIALIQLMCSLATINSEWFWILDENTTRCPMTTSTINPISFVVLGSNNKVSDYLPLMFLL